MKNLLLFTLVAVLSTPALSLAHGGRLNKCGCHMDRKANTCHCHRAPRGGCGPECYAKSSLFSNAESVFDFGSGSCFSADFTLEEDTSEPAVLDKETDPKGIALVPSEQKAESASLRE